MINRIAKLKPLLLSIPNSLLLRILMKLRLINPIWFYKDDNKLTLINTIRDADHRELYLLR